MGDATACMQSLTSPRVRVPLLLGFVFVVLLLVLYEANAYERLASLRTQWRGPDVVPTSPGLAVPEDGLADVLPMPLSDRLFPAWTGPDDLRNSRDKMLAENERTIAALFRCMERGDCGQNQTKVIILQSSPFRGLFNGDNAGEAIWATSVIVSLRNMGYSYLYADAGLEHMGHLYHIFRALVPVIFVEAPDSQKCNKDNNCILKKDKPFGIPVWKMLSFHFWSWPEHPLGRKWTVNPEPYRGPSRLLPCFNRRSIIIEPQCMRQPFIPHFNRTLPGQLKQAYILAKNAEYFSPEHITWDPSVFREAAAAVGVQFFTGAQKAGDKLPEYFPGNETVTNLWRMPQGKFYETLAKSAVLVGIGSPSVSPTPYDALCLGVPFINPIRGWDAKDPLDRTRWDSQHNLLKHLDPPYVYNVFKGDKEGLVQAVKDAVENPIDSFILDRMRIGAVQARLGEIIETDWKSEAEKVLRERKAYRKGEIFWIGP